MQSFVFPDVHVYEARNSYWPGQVLKSISGSSLYMTTQATTTTEHAAAAAVVITGIHSNMGILTDLFVDGI